MPDMIKHRFNRARIAVAAAGIAAVGAGLLINAQAVSEGVRRGLDICGGTLIPALFPFMVLSCFLSYGDYARALSIPLRPVTVGLFRLPRELGTIVLMSLIGGYPVGAKMIAELLAQNRIDRKTAERMLCFCVNSGPSFLVAAVGAGMLRSREAGVVLLASQTLATLVIGFVVSRGAPRPDAHLRPAPHMAGASALVTAVRSAMSAMLAMCAFAILFSGIMALVNAGGAVAAASALHMNEAVVKAFVGGFFEVTSGCAAAAELGGALSFGLISVFVSFGGLSVMFQIFSCFEAGQVSFKPYVLSRAAHAVLSTAIALPLYIRMCAHSPVWLSTPQPVAQTDSRTTLISVCLLGMCAIFTLSPGGERGRNPAPHKK